MIDDSKIILALDSKSVESSLDMIGKTKDYVAVYKLGLEFYLSNGLEGVSAIQSEHPELRFFLDLKLHDIPNTVAEAASSIAPLAPTFLTVHASGGYEMVKAAVDRLPNTHITAVTVLTSLDSDELKQLGLPGDAISLAVALAKRAVVAGAGAIVCSPHEAAQIRSAVGNKVLLITPGVRPHDSSADDQKRVMTPVEAISQGANFVVIGRPITKAADPAKAAELIFSSMQ